MASVADRIAQYEGLALQTHASRMSPELQRFLSLVWDRRNDQHLDIYSLYVGGRAHIPPLDEADPAVYPWPVTYNTGTVEAFLGAATNVPQLQPMVQPWGALSQFDIPAWTISGVRTWAGQFSAEEPNFWNQVVLKDLGHSFFHFRTGASPNRRVYMSVNNQSRSAMIGFAVGRIKIGIPGVTNVKVAGPLARGFDNIVVYCESQAVVSRVLDEIARFQNQENRAGWFNANTIHIARRMTSHGGQPLRGIAVAVEPGAHPEVLEKMNIAGKPSFGGFWEMILEPILGQSLGPARAFERSGTKVTFFEAVLKRLRDLGIDPRRPDL